MSPDKIKSTIKITAQALFRRFGYPKTSVNEIAKKAKIAKATIYKYFESKELILEAILTEYLEKSLQDIVHTERIYPDEKTRLSDLIMRTSRLSFTACNEYIGWEFLRENTNSQEFLKKLSDILEQLLIKTYENLPQYQGRKITTEGLKFLLKTSKNIVFSIAFTSVSEADIRKNFVAFRKELLPHLIKAALLI